MNIRTLHERSRAHSIRTLFGWMLLPLIFGSCAFGDRVMLMKEFKTSVSPGTAPGLSGKTVCVIGFTDETDVTAKWTKTEAAVAPAGFEYREMTAAEEASWDKELAERKEGKTASDFPVVGWMRNGFGMHTADVRAVNPPAEWLKQVLELELAGQGAKIGSEASADVVISGVIRYRKVDIYMSNWANLVVDFELRAKGKPPVRKTIHTSGKQLAWSSSAFEFYRAFRRCQQKLVWLLLPEIEALLAP